MNTAILLCAALFTATPVEPTARWNGIIADKSLQSVAPTTSFIASAESLAKVWKAWRPDEDVPSVDFAKELILVGVVSGPNTVLMRPSLDDQGDLRFVVAGTKRGGPGFGYLLLKVSREGVKTVNGKPLNVDSRPMLVTVKVLFGTDDESKKAKVEPWISKAVAEFGSPTLIPQTGWIALTGDEQRIYTSEKGGFIIDALVIERNGKHEVVIDGCEGVALEESVIVEPGDQRVVKFTWNNAPNNVFIAVAADLKTEEAIAVNVVGSLHTGVVAIGGETTGTTITANGLTWELDFGKNAELREAVSKLDGKSVKVSGTLKRQAGIEIRERWVVTVTELKAVQGKGTGALPKPSLQAAAVRSDTSIEFLKEAGAMTIDVTSVTGIDKATIKRESNEWPKSILVRLHLGGLESLKAGGKEVAVEWSIASTGEHEVRTMLVSGKRVAAITKDSPFYSEARIVGGERDFPLKRGYFEVSLPAQLFVGNPDEIRLEWVDFYRN